MLTVESLAEVDRILDMASNARSISDDRFRETLLQFCYHPSLPDRLPDPFSEDYKQFQLDLYSTLVGKPYHIANEKTDFDFDTAYRWPFPYSS